MEELLLITPLKTQITFLHVDSADSGELLLSAADKAFELKFGKTTDKVFPRDYASEIIDYNSDNYPLQGKEWMESDLPKKYSRLWEAYRH